MRDQSLGERDDYTSLTWLAGWTAMYGLNRPADAVGMFERYGRGARSPQTVSKGYYWGWGAALAAATGCGPTAISRRPGSMPTVLRTAGAGTAWPHDPRPCRRQSRGAASATCSTAFNQSSIVRAAQYLAAPASGRTRASSSGAIAATADSDENLLMASELARSINRPDLA